MPSDGDANGRDDDVRPRKVAVVGGGFAGVAVAWHVMNRLAEACTRDDDSRSHSGDDDDDTNRRTRPRPVALHLYDENGIAGGASGVAAGLLHPYTPRGKIIWRGVEGVAATLRLVEAAEAAERTLDERERTSGGHPGGSVPRERAARRGEAIAWRVGTVRPARDVKQGRDLARFAAAATRAGGGGVCVGPEELARLLPGIEVPGDITRELDRLERLDAVAAEGVKREKDVAAGVSVADDEAAGEGGEGFDGGGGRRAGGRKARRSAARSAATAPAPVAALHIPEGLVLDTGRYLSALWDAVGLLVESEQTPLGTSAELRKQTIASLRDDLAEYDTVVVAAGAAVGSIEELSGPDVLPLQLQGGHVIELVPPVDESAVDAWDERQPGILGAPYVAPLGPSRVLVGTTKEFGVSTAHARRAGLVTRDNASVEQAAAAEAAKAELVAKSTQVYPPLAGMAVDVVRYGVRANPPRTPSGSLPLVGRILVKTPAAEDRGPSNDDDATEDEHDASYFAPDWWYVGGLGARGLVYHGMLGDIVAQVVFTGDDDVVPPELRFNPRVSRVDDDR